MVKLKISLDVEGVLADIHSPWVRDFNKRNSVNMDIADIDWDFSIISSKIELERNYILSDFMEYTDNLWKNKQWDLINTTETNLAEKLNELDCDIVTARNRTQEMKEWLLLQGVHNKKIIFEIAKPSLDYTIYIDDTPFMYKSLKPWQIQILYNKPWNKNIKEDNVLRAMNFKEVLDILETFGY